MSVFVTGDTHGPHPFGYKSVDGFMKRFHKDNFSEQKNLTKNDFVIICGDFGGIWDCNRFITGESDDEKFSLDWLENRPFTTLFVPGNHENYDRLIGCKNEKLLNSWFYERMPDMEKDKLRKGYPRKEWHGGFVREIRPSVLMLERGYIFDIDGLSCFAFGGAKSHDINDGILDPSDFDSNEEFKKTYKRWNDERRMFRVRGVSWWDEEIPSEEEMERGKKNIQEFMKTHDKIDCVFTHEPPASDSIYLGFDSNDFNKYLESLNYDMKYSAWFYGHLHDNRRVFTNHYLLYEQIALIN